jgi:hypothetical protein
MSEFSEEPIVGHSVRAERYTPDSKLGDAIDHVAEVYGIPRRDNERVRITVGDVDWDESKTLSIDCETFEQLIEWYQNE